MDSIGATRENASPIAQNLQLPICNTTREYAESATHCACSKNAHCYPNSAAQWACSSHLITIKLHLQIVYCNSYCSIPLQVVHGLLLLVLGLDWAMLSQTVSMTSEEYPQSTSGQSWSRYVPLRRWRCWLLWSFLFDDHFHMTIYYIVLVVMVVIIMREHHTVGMCVCVCVCVCIRVCVCVHGGVHLCAHTVVSRKYAHFK